MYIVDKRNDSTLSRHRIIFSRSLYCVQLRIKSNMDVVRVMVFMCLSSLYKTCTRTRDILLIYWAVQGKGVSYVPQA